VNVEGVRCDVKDEGSIIVASCPKKKGERSDDNDHHQEVKGTGMMTKNDNDGKNLVRTSCSTTVTPRRTTTTIMLMVTMLLFLLSSSQEKQNHGTGTVEGFFATINNRHRPAVVTKQNHGYSLREVNVNRILLNMVVDNTNSRDDDDENFDFKGFNPLNYKVKSASASASSSSRDYSTRISLRATIMQQLNSELVDAIEGSDFDQKIQIILRQYQDFLLDPLENENAAMVSWFL
jgi:hypothetical protein